MRILLNNPALKPRILRSPVTHVLIFKLQHTECGLFPLGIGSFTIVDGEKVTGEDVGNK